eukprot:4969492-Amphidinium_carterae.1
MAPTYGEQPSTAPAEGQPAEEVNYIKWCWSMSSSTSKFWTAWTMERSEQSSCKLMGGIH